jgi:methyl-accepting chemotaxis protein
LWRSDFSSHVGAAANSVEELAASIRLDSEQAAKSTDVAGSAVSEAQRTVETMRELGARIGEVIGLIQAIAGQTNLLAAQRHHRGHHGEAGKDFAVVASEVKSLAGQTPRKLPTRSTRSSLQRPTLPRRLSR